MQAKKTADALGIFARSREAHLASVRHKMNCRNNVSLAIGDLAI